MENNERDRKLDQWLDEALSQYSAAEPRLGLEQRVVAQVHAEEQARAERRNWWRWMPAFAAIAAVMIVAVAVKPYWESKTGQTSANILTPAPTNNHASETKNEAETKPQDSSVSRAKKVVPAPADSRAEEERRMAVTPTQTKDAAVDGKREAAALEQALPASKAYRTGSNYAANLNAPSRDSDAIATEKKAGRALLSIAPSVAAAPSAAPAASSNAVGGVVGSSLGGRVTSDELNAAKVATAAQAPSRPAAQTQSETVEVQSATQMVEAQNGVIGTERVKVPDVSKQLKTIKLKPKGALAKKLGEDVSGDDLGFTALRTDMKHVPPGPVQQFPTPMPLSREEELMLAAAKQLKGKPINEVKNDGGIPAIEIKRVEIAPLEGPPN